MCTKHLQLTGLLQCFDAVGWWQEGHPACKKTEWWGAGTVICLEQGADLHTAQMMPLPLIVSCFSKIQTGLTFLVPAHLGSPGKRAVKRVSVCVCGLLQAKALAMKASITWCLSQARINLEGCSRKAIWHKNGG